VLRLADRRLLERYARPDALIERSRNSAGDATAVEA
jgi:hypothetical protein